MEPMIFWGIFTLAFIGVMAILALRVITKR